MDVALSGTTPRAQGLDEAMQARHLILQVLHQRQAPREAIGQPQALSHLLVPVDPAARTVCPFKRRYVDAPPTSASTSTRPVALSRNGRASHLRLRNAAASHGAQPAQWALALRGRVPVRYQRTAPRPRPS
jgi:hypothetical protein